jgi:hypothetical protein
VPTKAPINSRPPTKSKQPAIFSFPLNYIPIISQHQLNW